MPNHTSWLHYVLHYFEEVLSHNAHYIGNTFYADTPPTWRSFEPIGGAIGICIVIVLVSLMVRGRIARGVEPDSRFTLPTAVEVFLSYFVGQCGTLTSTGDWRRIPQQSQAS